MPDRALPAPFLKWAGGKRQLLPRILQLVPPRIDTYYEPFIGGGAVFFALAARRAFRRAVIGDANPELCNCYQAVRDDVDGVIAALHQYQNDRDLYYQVRAQDSSRWTPAARAARVIFLNRCGYNGLYRVNSRGKFNVPFGRYRRPVICDEAKLRAAAGALQKVRIACGDFAKLLPKVGLRDFVYLDPPTCRSRRPRRSPPTPGATSAALPKSAWGGSCACWPTVACRRCSRTPIAPPRGGSIRGSTSSGSGPAGPSTRWRAGADRSTRSWSSSASAPEAEPCSRARIA